MKRPPLSGSVDGISSFSSSLLRFPTKGQRLILVPRGSPMAIRLQEDIAYRLRQRQQLFIPDDEDHLEDVLPWSESNFISDFQEMAFPPDQNHSSAKRDLTRLEVVPLSLESHPGLAIVPLQREAMDGEFMVEQNDYVELGIGPEEDAVKIRLTDTSVEASLAPYSSSDSLSRYSLVREDGSLLIVSSTELVHGSPVTMTSWLSPSQIDDASSSEVAKHFFVDLEGRGSFILHQDGSLSPLHAQHLVIGISPYPAVTLVERYSIHCFLFQNADDFWKAPAPVNGTPLILKSHPGLAVTAGSLYRGAFGIAEIQDLVVAPINEVEILNLTSIDFKKHHEFALSSSNDMNLIPLNLHLAVNVPLRLVKYNVSRGSLAFTLLSFLIQGPNTTWVVNSEGSISPLNAPHLALGCQYISDFADPQYAKQQRLIWRPADQSRLSGTEETMTPEVLRILHQVFWILFSDGIYRHVVFLTTLIALFLIRLVPWPIWMTIVVRLWFGKTISGFFFGMYVGSFFSKAVFKCFKKSKTVP